MFFHFPRIKTTRTSEEQVQKIIDEAIEFLDAAERKHQDEELIDVLHAVETAIRVHFKGREGRIKTLIDDVILKNHNRGYYDEDCF